MIQIFYVISVRLLSLVKKRPTRHLQQMFFPIMAIFFFASNGALSKQLLTQMSPLLIMLYVQLLSFALIMSYFGAYSEIKKIWNESYHKRIIFVLFAFLSGTVGPLLMLYGLKYTSVLNVALLSNSYSLYLFIFSIFLFKEKITLNQCLGMIVLFLGVLMIVFKGSFIGITFNKGDLMLVLSQLSWCVADVLYKKYLKNIHSDVAILGRNMLATMVLSFVLYTSSTTLNLHVRSDLIIYLMALTFFPAIMGQFLWYKAVKITPPLLLSNLNFLFPLFGAFFAWAIMSESLYFYHLVGGLMMLIGLKIGQHKNHHHHFWHHLHFKKKWDS